MKHIVQTANPGLLHDEFIATNDGTASPTGMQQVANAFNFISCKQKKLIMIRAQDHTGPIVPGAGATVQAWPFLFRSGENTSALVVRYGCKLTSAAASAPTVQLQLHEFTDGLSTDPSAGVIDHSMAPGGSAGAVNPSQVLRRAFVARELAANTLYHGRFDVFDGTVMMFCVAHEEWTVQADDTIAGVCSPDKFHAEGPIYDEHAQDFCQANNLLWKHNGAPYIGWSPDYNNSHASVPTTTSTSYADLIANSAGFYVDATYHATRRRTTVPVTMAVRAIRLSGAGTASFRLTDGTNNIDISAAAIGASSRWFTTTATIPASAATWRMQHLVSVGTTEVRTEAWSLFPYEA